MFLERDPNESDFSCDYSSDEEFSCFENIVEGDEEDNCADDTSENSEAPVI